MISKIIPIGIIDSDFITIGIMKERHTEGGTTTFSVSTKKSVDILSPRYVTRRKPSTTINVGQ